MQTRLDFTPEDEAHMTSAANWGVFLAAASVLVALLGVGSSIVQLGRAPELGVQNPGFDVIMWVGLATNAGIPLVLGVFLWRACSSFKKVATTDEDDPVHLLRGFRGLRGYFMTQGVVFIVGAILVTAFFFLDLSLMGFWDRP